MTLTAKNSLLDGSNDSNTNYSRNKQIINCKMYVLYALHLVLAFHIEAIDE